MNLSDKERTFLVRGLDKATTPDEADTCAKNFFKELRKRGIDGYRFIDQMDYAEYERERLITSQTGRRAKRLISRILATLGAMPVRLGHKRLAGSPKSLLSLVP